jgi:hypothetical protein
MRVLRCEPAAHEPRPSALSTGEPALTGVHMVGAGAAAGALEIDALGMLRWVLVSH